MTIKEIAQLAGVSVSTVSKIIHHNDSMISEATRAKVLAVIKEYNYSPYSFVNAAKSRSFILAVIFRDTIIDEMFLKGVMDTAREHGYVVLTLESRNDSAQEIKNISLIMSNHVDGLLWEPVSEGESAGRRADLEKAGIPYSLFDWSSQRLSGINYHDMGYYLTQELVKAGHTNIACLALDNDTSQSSEFIAGYRNSLFDAGISFKKELLFYKDPDRLVDRLSMLNISAIMTLQYKMALHICQRLVDSHLQIPTDYSVVTLSKHSSNLRNNSSLSALVIPFYQYAMYLSEQLVAKVEKTEDPEAMFLPVYELSSRHTIGTPSHENRKKLLSIGSINIDEYLTFPELPHSGITAITSRTASYPGGTALNYAIGAAKLGHPVSLVGMVGDDIDADLIYSSLKNLPIDASHVRRLVGEKTGKAYIFLDHEGNSMISIISGANRKLCKEDIQKSRKAFQNCAFCLLSNEMARDTITEACLLAKKNGVQTIFKPSSAKQLEYSILPYIDIFVPNLNELHILLPEYTDLSEAADHLLAQGIKLVIITLGKEGLYAKGMGIDRHFPAEDAAAVDTTGASDAFICALASYLMYGYELSAAIQIAIFASTFNISREGVAPSMADKNTLEAYVQKIRPELLLES